MNRQLNFKTPVEGFLYHGLMQVSPRHSSLSPFRPKSKAPLEANTQGVESLDSVTLSAATEKALNSSLQSILKHSTKKVSAELAGLPAQALMYHGSDADFEAVEPRPNTRRGAEKIDWQGTAIFAARDPRVGLHYTAEREPGFPSVSTCATSPRLRNPSSTILAVVKVATMP